MIIAVVATRNEATTIGPLIHLLKEHVDRVIVSDESDDDTPTEASWAGARVLTSNTRLGIGPSLLRAWEEALHWDATRIVQIDAGGSHDPEDIPALLQSRAHVVIGSRFVPGSQYIGRPWRNTASQIYGYSMYARSGLPVRDWTSGFRVFTPGALTILLGQPYTARMHGWQAEVLLHAHRNHMWVEEIPIRYQAGDTSLRMPHVWEALRVR